MRLIKQSLLFSLLLVVLCFTQQNPLSIKEQISFKVPSSITVSPTGGHIAFTVRSADLQNSSWNYQVYLLHTGDKSCQQFTLQGKSCTKPLFSPDGKYLLYLTDREYQSNKSGTMESGTQQVWFAPLSGGEGKNLTTFSADVEEYIFSPKGDLVACLSALSDPAKEDLADRNKKLKNDEAVYPKTNPVKVLTILKFPSGEEVASIPLDAGAAEIKFHPTENKIVYQSNLTGEYNDEQKFDLYTVSFPDGAKTQLTKDAGPETSPAWSPDGKYIAFKTQTVPDIEFAETDLTIMDTKTGVAENVTKDFNFSVNTLLWKDATTLILTVNEGMAETIYSYSLKSKSLKRIDSGKGSYSEISLTKSGSICSKLETASALPEVEFAEQTVTDFSEQLLPYRTGTQEVISYTSADGKFTIEGILFKPAGFDAGKKYPLILTCHGGPYGNFKNTFTQGYPVRQLLEAGYLVFAPNPRGSSGYSDAFSQDNRYDLGGGDYKDIMSGVDFLINKGIVDKDRMGVMGGSYGGYLTNWIISQTPRFKAAVSLYGIFSFFTDFSNSWQPIFEKMYFGYYYWEKPIDANNLYVKLSPSTYTENIKTPTLILQGDKDVYTDISNSRELYQALHTRGIPTEFVVYPREGHGIRGEPNHYINTVDRTLGWFKRWLK